MSLTKSWSAIHYASLRSLKEYISKHSEDIGESIDINKLFREANDLSGSGNFSSSEREFPLRVFQYKTSIDEGIEYHFKASVRWFISAMKIFENDMRAFEKSFSDYELEQAIYTSGKLMIMEYSCAIQHTAACEVLKSLKNNDPEMHSKAMTKSREDKRVAERLVLIYVVKHLLDKLRPEGGWKGGIEAAQKITKKILLLKLECALPVPDNEAELYKKISELIDLESTVTNVYKTHAKNPRDDPAARRRVKFPKY